MSELLPCPFCGGSNLAEGFHSPFVICEDCGAFGPGSADITHEEAVNRWNTRAELTCHINELDSYLQLKERYRKIAKENVEMNMVLAKIYTAVNDYKEGR